MDSVHLGIVLITAPRLQVDGGDLVLIRHGFRQSGVQNKRTCHQSIQMRHVIVPKGT